MQKGVVPEYISGVGGVVLIYQPHSGDTYPLETEGLLPPSLVNDGMFMGAPPILGMYLILPLTVLVGGSRSVRLFFFNADLGASSALQGS